VDVDVVPHPVCHRIGQQGDRLVAIAH
jgi:hypothetical protein